MKIKRNNFGRKMWTNAKKKSFQNCPFIFLSLFLETRH